MADNEIRIDAMNKEAAKKGEVTDHQAVAHAKHRQKTVTDPTTGKEVVIEDTDIDAVKALENQVKICCASRMSRS